MQETESDYHLLRIWIVWLPESQNHFSPLSARHRESCVLRFGYYDAMFRREMIEIHNKHEDRNPDSSMRWTREHIPFWMHQFLYAHSLLSQFSVYYNAVKASLNTHQGSFHPSIYRVQETKSGYYPLRIWMVWLPESQNHFSPLSVRHRESCVLRFDYYDAMFRREMIEIHNKHEDRTSFLIETRWLSHKLLLCQSKSNGNPSVIKRTVVSPWYSHMYAFVIICL